MATRAGEIESLMAGTPGPNDSPRREERADDAIGRESETLAVRWVAAQPRVMGYLLTVVRDFHHAEDLLQEVARVTAEKYPTYDTSRPFLAWVLGIARNLVLAHYRSRSRDHQTLPGEVLEDLALAFDRVDPQADVRRAALRRCVDKVSGRRRRVLEMRYEQGLRPADIANQVGMTVNALFVMLHRIRSTLLDCVNRELAREQA